MLFPEQKKNYLEDMLFMGLQIVHTFNENPQFCRQVFFQHFR